MRLPVMLSRLLLLGFFSFVLSACGGGGTGGPLDGGCHLLHADVRRAQDAPSNRAHRISFVAGIIREPTPTARPSVRWGIDGTSAVGSIATNDDRSERAQVDPLADSRNGSVHRGDRHDDPQRLDRCAR